MPTRDLVDYLGKQVRVTLAHTEDPDGEPKRIAEGMLLGLGESGEFVIQDDMGFVHYCWPLLDIEEVRNEHPDS